MAREIFSEMGYAGTTFSEVADRTGLTRPAVNHYFGSKEDLYTALFESTHDSVVAAGIKNAGNQDGLAPRLSAFLEAATQIDSRDRSYAQFMAASVFDALRHDELRDRARDQLEDVRSFVEQTLRLAIEHGEVRADLDVPAVTEMLVAALWGMSLYAGFVGTHEQLESVVAQFGRLLEGDHW